MPTPARTSLDEIIDTSRNLIEAEGLEGLTMQGVAERVGVRAPSLYKRVAGRDHLIRLVVESVIEELSTSLEKAMSGEDPGEDLIGIAYAFRRFGLENPGTYGLIFSPLPEESRPDPERLIRASDPVLRTTAALAGPDRALAAARTVTAWAHGFVSMELAGAFRMGGDIDEAFDYGVRHLSAVLTD